MDIYKDKAGKLFAITHTQVLGNFEATLWLQPVISTGRIFTPKSYRVDPKASPVPICQTLFPQFYTKWAGLQVATGTSIDPTSKTSEL